MTAYTKCVRIPPDVYEKANTATEKRRMALNAYVAGVLEREAGWPRYLRAPTNVPSHVSRAISEVAL